MSLAFVKKYKETLTNWVCAYMTYILEIILFIIMPQHIVLITPFCFLTLPIIYIYVYTYIYYLLYIILYAFPLYLCEEISVGGKFYKFSGILCTGLLVC